MDLEHPLNDFSDLLFERFGEEGSAFEKGYSRPVTLRVNTLKAQPEEVEEELSSLGIAAETVPWYGAARIVRGAKEEEIARLKLYSEGKIYLQSLSSMLPPLILEPKAGESILDMTAAPGGKTTELFALSEGKALITACERDKIRFERLRYNLARQGAERVSALLCDASALDDAFSFDKILLDAPCTGSGTATPEHPVRVTRAYLKKCVAAQEKLLKKALRLLRNGGKLVYSTCSVFPEENEMLVERVLKEGGGELLPVPKMEGLPLFSGENRTLRVRPNELYEGFFVALIQKTR